MRRRCAARDCGPGARWSSACRAASRWRTARGPSTPRPPRRGLPGAVPRARGRLRKHIYVVAEDCKRPMQSRLEAPPRKVIVSYSAHLERKEMKGDERDERKAVSRKRTNLSYRNESLPTARRSSARRAPRWSPRRRRRRPRPRRCRPRPRPRFAEPEGCTCIETHVQPGTGSELASGNILLRAQAQAQGWGGANAPQL